MSNFVKKYFNTNVIVVNDIGAVCFFPDARIIDLAGLATFETAQLIVKKDWDTEAYKSLFTRKGADIAIAYEKKVKKLNQPWEECGRMTISQNIICGEPEIIFYAVKPYYRKPLIDALREFSETLSEDIKVSIVE
jgi:hypothetical protein